jgi:hypothetical protein
MSVNTKHRIKNYILSLQPKTNGYKHGLYAKETKFNCVDCKKEIPTKLAIRCLKCNRIYVGTIVSKKMQGKKNHRYGIKGILSASWTGNSICPKCKGKKSHKSRICWKCYLKTNLMRKRKYCKHHLDLNTANNKKSNILKLTNKQHQLFHRLAYHYLVYVLGLKEVKKYIKWFVLYLKKRNYTFFKRTK